jgi:serine protease Do
MGRKLTVLAAVLVATACGPTASTSVPPSTTAISPSAAASSPAPVGSIDALPGAVIQIEATGVFREPDEDAQKVAARGSGFIIDPSGVAVTNNHVVTGADTLAVWVGAERTEYSARVLGASECSDLAVIKIDTPRPLPYLSWYDGEISPGLDIYAAGFPLGDPEFTLTRGIVSRAHGILDESWAWVQNSIEHDANTNPGSSGGPIVTADGRVVAVHYAGDPDTSQHWAIARDEAVGVIDELRKGQDLYSTGVNGSAGDFLDHDGIWVSSVKPGSPAAKAGLKAGDIITKLADTDLAIDGTMKEYCEVLRSHGATDVLPIEIFREDSGEVLVGELNGTALIPGFSFATEIAGGGPSSGTEPGAFVEKSDDTDTLFTEVPEDWSDVRSAAWSIDKVDVGPGILASPKIDLFKHGWKTPGVYVAASSTAAESETIDGRLDIDAAKFRDDCKSGGRKDFTKGIYTGRYDVWEKCKGTDTRLVVIAALSKDHGHMIYVQFQAVTDPDLAVLDRVLATLTVGDLP